MADLKKVYQSITEEQALNNLALFKKNGVRYTHQQSKVVKKTWIYYQYSLIIQKVIYTTNIIEGLNRQFRKVTKTKGSFPNDDSLKKMLYLAVQNLSIK